jgi:hypothetical protein
LLDLCRHEAAFSETYLPLLGIDHNFMSTRRRFSDARHPFPGKLHGSAFQARSWGLPFGDAYLFFFLLLAGWHNGYRRQGYISTVDSETQASDPQIRVCAYRPVVPFSFISESALDHLSSLFGCEDHRRQTLCIRITFTGGVGDGNSIQRLVIAIDRGFGSV